jgi:predicted kinase
MILKSFDQFIAEGVNDPNILKAVFLAGGPGSGKSYATRQVFGIDDVTSRTSSLGLKILNSDDMFEFMLGKKGVSPGDLASMTPDEFAKHTEGPSSARELARGLTNKQFGLWLAGRLGLIIDGTGRDYAKIAETKEKLEQLGYDTSMIFVNTTLPVALERNRKRDRKLPDHLVEDLWNEVQKNIGRFQSLFKGDMVIIDNSESGDFNKMHGEKIKAIEKLIKSPVKNPKGKEWIRSQR